MTARRLARAATAIALVTVAARLVGLLRVFVLTRTVGDDLDVADAYLAANTVPNILFEVVAGGALAAVVVPALAGAEERGDRDQVRAVTSALLTRVAVVLLPVALVGVLLREPVMRLLSDDPEKVEVGARMLAVFMPQVVLYGVGIVLAGVLQAHHRFVGPALAPLLSSVVVIAAYIGYDRLGDTGLSRREELVLSVGTTAGVAVLSLSLLVPAARLRLGLRPRWSLPAGVGSQLRRLAGYAALAVAAQQLLLGLVLRLADPVPGGVLAYNVGYTAFLLPWAVVAVPVATSAFPALARSAAARDDAAYRAVARGSTTTVVVGMLATAAALVAVADPAARLLLGVRGGGDVALLAGVMRALAPGLVGYGLLALLTRALYARDDGRAPALAAVAGFALAGVVDVAAALTLDGTAQVVALGAGHSVGLTLTGVLLLHSLHRAVPGSTSGKVESTMRAAATSVVAAGLGTLLARALPGTGPGADLVRVGLVGLVALGVVVLPELVVAVLRLPGAAPPGVPAGSAAGGVAGRRVVLVLATSTGGVGRHVHALAAGLAAAGASVVVAGPTTTLATFDFAATGAATAAVPIGASPRPDRDWRAVRRLRAVLADADLVHAHGVRAGLVAALARGPAPLVVTWHNAVLGSGLRRAVGGLLERVVARRADLTLAVSADLVARAGALGARSVRLAPVGSTRPVAERGRAATRAALLDGRDDRPVVVTIARLNAQKGLDVLVEAASMLPEPRPLFVVAGDGPERASLEAQIARTNAPVRLLGDRQDVGDLLAAADLVALPSRWEGSPLAAHETLLAGRPLVATAVGGLPDLLGGGAARLVPPEDPAALAAAIRDLLDDPAGRDALARAGADRGREWPTAERAVAAVVVLHAQLVGAR
jgi:putative peptidoglycan lipid II flippase